MPGSDPTERVALITGASAGIGGATVHGGNAPDGYPTPRTVFRQERS